MSRLLGVTLLAGAFLAMLVPARPAPPLVKPTNLAAVNTSADEDDPFVSVDGLRLYYVTTAEKHLRLMVSSRKRAGQPWPSGEAVEGPDPETDNRSPYLTGDNHDLYFATRFVVRSPDKETQAGSNFDIVHSIKVMPPHQFTGPTPVQAVCTPEDELHPWLTGDGLELYFSRKTAAGWRVLVVRRRTAKEAFQEPKEIAELPADFHHATLDRFGRSMYLQGPLENGRWGLFRTTRGTAKQPWAKPKLLDMVNSSEGPQGDMSPCLSRDGSKLYFASDRPGGKGGRDLWVVDTVYLH